MFEFQNIIAMLILVAALAYAGTMLWKKTRAFSGKAGCADDCGCSSKSKTPKIVH
ncbi:MAG: FeoB-associated Cys-rich membrane protein [Acidobacteriota bacterium]